MDEVHSLHREHSRQQALYHSHDDIDTGFFQLGSARPRQRSFHDVATVENAFNIPFAGRCDCITCIQLQHGIAVARFSGNPCQDA